MIYKRSRLLGWTLLIGLLIPFSQPSSSAVLNLAPDSKLAHNMVNYPRNDPKIGLQWVVDAPLRGDQFPIIFYNEIGLNLTIQTTWGLAQNTTFNPLQLSSDSGNVVWVSLPETQIGTGSVDLVLNTESQGYPVEWVKQPAITKVPTRIEYSYKWHSYWAGATLLSVNLWANGTIQATNHILRRSNIGGFNLGLYNSSFNFVQHHAITNWTAFWDPIDLSEAHKWQSWEYRRFLAMCDGGGFEERGVLYWGNNAEHNTSVQKILDNDNCSGVKSIFSHPEISRFLNLIRTTANESITTHLNPKNTTPESTKSDIGYTLPGVILSLSSLLVLVILKKRRDTKFK